MYFLIEDNWLAQLRPASALMWFSGSLHSLCCFWLFMYYLVLFWSLLLKSVSCFDCPKYVSINFEDIFHHFWLLPRHLLGFYPHTFSFTGSYWSGSLTMHSISYAFLHGYMWCYLFFRFTASVIWLKNAALNSIYCSISPQRKLGIDE